MKKINRFLIVILIILVVLFLYRKSQKVDMTKKIEPATIEAIAGSELKGVKLTAKANERLGIKTEKVRWARDARGVIRKVVPYSSIIYDLNGDTWVYVSLESLVFVRNPIIVDYIDGDIVYLSEGPLAGTDVVAVGVAELYGIDTGVGK